MYNNYFDTLDERVKNYFSVLEPEFPQWLYEYINTKELLSQAYVSVTCGTIYSDLFTSDFFFSSLDHSIAVALIVWHFTHDKKQTLAGLFHDIATPAFKHCVDFLNGDYMVQESTEDLTTYIIKNSKEITALLKRDDISISEVNDYHIYPIADNDTPRLSADRLEYSLSNALFTYKIADIDEIKSFYCNISVQTNEDNIIELGFSSESVAKKFVELTSVLSVDYREDKTRYSMQFIADILKGLNADGKICKSDLYSLKESDIINLIENSKYSKIFNIWRKSTNVNVSVAEPKNVYYVNHGAKVRYIDPLCNGARISEVSKDAKNMIEKNLSYKMDNYVYLDFDFPE